MNTYRVTGYIFIEGPLESARYDADMQSDSDPTDLEIFDFLVNSGIIQIIHEETELIESDDDDYEEDDDL